MSGSHPLRPVVLLGDDPAAVALRDVLATRDGWAGLPSIALLARMSRLLWGHEVGAGEAGVSSLVDRPHLAASLRRLADAVVSPAVPHGTSYSVDVVRSPELLGRYVRDVWPDALAVAVGAPDGSTGTAAADPDLWVAPEEIVGDLAAVAERVAGAAAQSSLGLPGPPEFGEITFRPNHSPLHGRVIIVLGAARSGTTWVHRLISAHEDVAGTETGETWLFPDVAPLWSDDLRASAGDDLLLTALRAFCDDLLSGLLREPGCNATYICEKTPTTVWQLPFVAQLYPDAQYVHVIRDGRDAAASLTLTRGADGDAAAAAREWVDAVSAIRATAPSLSRFTEIRYEELIETPSAVIERTWDQLGVAVSDASRAALAARIGERVTPLPAAGDIGVGKWRLLPEPDRTQVETVTAELLRELNYVGAS